MCIYSIHTHFMHTMFLAATKQLYDWFSPSVCPSVRLSVRPSVTPFSPCSHHRIIMKFSGLITSDKSDVHAKGQGQRSKVKVTEVKINLILSHLISSHLVSSHLILSYLILSYLTQLSRSRTVTLV